MRVLILIAIGLLLYIIISNLLRKARLESNKTTHTEKMVKCAQCGLHVPQHEAIQQGENYFCSQQHQKDFN
jgi:uncharacterized protein